MGPAKSLTCSSESATFLFPTLQARRGQINELSWKGWYAGWIMLTKFTTMPLFEPILNIWLMTHSLSCLLLYGLGRWAAGCLPLALGPAFTQGAPTICIIATPARTTDKQASWLDTAGHWTLTTTTCHSLWVAQLKQLVQSFWSEKSFDSQNVSRFARFTSQRAFFH